MGYSADILRYFGLDRVPIQDEYEKAPRAAFLTCRRCGAFVSAEGQTLHTEWHRAPGA